VSPSIRGRRAAGLTALLAVGVPAALIMPASSLAADAASGSPWTKRIEVDRSARALPARDTTAEGLARAVLVSNAKRLGLGRKLKGLELVRRVHTPPRYGARSLTQLRFRQTAGSLRVVWSQIDVDISAGRVGTISATVVPVKSGPATGERRVSRQRALTIARRVVAGPERALSPLEAAYAGAPTTRSDAARRDARRAWIVEVHPKRRDAQRDHSVCIVVDAETGEVIGRWAGIADRPDRGPDARGAQTRAPSARAATDVPDPTPKLLTVTDGSFDPGLTYARFRTNGDPHPGANWPSFQQARLPGVTPTDAMDTLSANAANVARTICTVRDYCGALGHKIYVEDHTLPPGWRRTTYRGWGIRRNPSGDSYARLDSLAIFIASKHIAYSATNPANPFNDMIAHEMGHVRDYVTADDRADHLGLDSRTVVEALADMFAYDYDRGDGTLGEATTAGPIRGWANPGSFTVQGQPYPDHMDDYDGTPPGADDQKEYFNSTILSHAYHRFVQRVGHDKAGHVLQRVPPRLSPRPTFTQLRDAFVDAATALYGESFADNAEAAFRDVGL